MSRRPTAAGTALSAAARQQIDTILATARNQIETVLQREVSRLVMRVQEDAREEAGRRCEAAKQSLASPAIAQPIYVRPGRAQQLFGVHRATLYRWADAGNITIHKRGSASFVRVDELRAFLEGNQP